MNFLNPIPSTLVVGIWDFLLRRLHHSQPRQVDHETPFTLSLLLQPLSISFEGSSDFSSIDSHDDNDVIPSATLFSLYFCGFSLSLSLCSNLASEISTH